jgi:hypothetical protein
MSGLCSVFVWFFIFLKRKKCRAMRCANLQPNRMGGNFGRKKQRNPTKCQAVLRHSWAVFFQKKPPHRRGITVGRKKALAWSAHNAFSS